MGKNQAKPQRHTKKNIVSSVEDARAETSLMSNLDRWVEPRLELFFWISFFLTLLLGLLFFDPKVSIGGDDSIYVNRAYNFLAKGIFPTFQGPLYPLLLALIMSFSGINLIVFKMVSILFMLGHLWFYYKTFKKYLSPAILVFLLMVLSTNYSLITFASTTYSEPIFLFLQSLFIYLFDRYFIDTHSTKFDLKSHWSKFIIAGLVIFLLVILRNIGLIALIAAAIYFLFRKQWLAIAFIVVGFLVFQVPFNLSKRYIWNLTDAQISGQSKTLFQKNPYDSSQGTEDFSGFVDRLTQNSQYYLSHHFLVIFGLKSGDRMTKSGVITLLIYAIFIMGLILAFRESKFWTFAGLYIAVGCGVTFLVLQLFWNQERLILVFAPLILTFLMHTIHQGLNVELKKFKMVLPALMAIFLLANTAKTFARIPQATTALSHYTKGDRFFGYTQDWVNYLKMTEWCGQHLPDSAYVACRKPGMAFVYSGGKDFYGIYRVPSDDANDLYQRLKDAGVNYVIMANLLVNPNDPNGRTINTVRRYLTAIHSAYPDKLKFVHKIGEQNPAFLYQLN